MTPSPLAARESAAELLASATYDNTAAWQPRFEWAKVVKVYDGDTVHLAAPVAAVVACAGSSTSPANGVARFSARLLGLNAAELRTSDATEKAAATASRDALAARCLGRLVRVECGGLDKYGRVLVRLWLADADDTDADDSSSAGDDDRALSLNDWLLKHRYAVAYAGGTRAKTDWSTYPQHQLQQQ